MKKLLALVLVAVMAFSCLVLASCGDKKEESSTASENSTASADESKADESATSTDESAASADESATSEDAKSEDATSEDATSEDATSEDATSEDATSEDATSEDALVEIPESIKETASYKYFASIDMTKGFTITTDIMGISLNMSVLGESVYMETSIEMEGVSESAKIIVKDGKAYMLDDAEKTYTVSDATGEEIPVDEFSAEAIFSDLVEYVSTTTEEIEGVTFTVDNFKTSEGKDAKIYMDAEGKVVMMGDSEMMIPFELTNSVPEGCFDIPADYTEAAIELPEVSFDVNEDVAA